MMTIVMKTTTTIMMTIVMKTIMKGPEFYVDARLMNRVPEFSFYFK